MRARIAGGAPSKVLVLPRRRVPEAKIIKPVEDDKVKLTVAQVLSIRMGNQITATPSAHWGMSARRNKTSPPIKMRVATAEEQAFAFKNVPEQKIGSNPPSNLRIADIETWDRRLFKRMSPWVRKKVRETYMAEK
jgi:hypothetical protein